MQVRSRKILVTGASGFLGRQVLRELCLWAGREGEVSVTALTGRPEELAHAWGADGQPQVYPCGRGREEAAPAGDADALRPQGRPFGRGREEAAHAWDAPGGWLRILHRDAVFSRGAEGLFEGSLVLNLAYPRNATGPLVADGISYIQRVCCAAARNGAAAFANISSQSVYPADRKEAASEDMPVSLDTPYAVGKYAVEKMVQGICENGQIPYSNIRMASLIGPGFDQRIVNRFVRQAMDTGRLAVRKNRQKFGFFDVQDAAQGLLALADSDPLHWKQVYNLGGRGAYTLQEVAEAVRQSLSPDIDVRIDWQEGGEAASSALDARAFYRDFSFAPSLSLKDSTDRIYAHMKRGRDGAEGQVPCTTLSM